MPVSGDYKTIKMTPLGARKMVDGLRWAEQQAKQARGPGWEVVPPRRGFWAIIADAGPMGEDDKTDNTFWFQAAAITSSAMPIAWTAITGGIWDVCTNTFGGGHNIPVGTAVFVSTMPDAATPPVMRFLISVDTLGSFAVTVSTDGGDAGDPTTSCSFTYAVNDRDTGDTLSKDNAGDSATGISPVMQRRAIGVTVAGLVGMARYKPDGTLELIWVDEVPAVVERTC